VPSFGVIILAHDKKITVPRVRPDGRIAGAAHAEEFDVSTTGGPPPKVIWLQVYAASWLK
jgi:hypothetical protein